MNDKTYIFTPKTKNLYVIRNTGSLILKIIEINVSYGLPKAQLFAS